MADDPMWMPWYYAIGIASWPVIRGLLRLRDQGVENLPAGGFVLAANHVSNLDPWPLGFPLWPKRRLRWMAKAELFNWVLGPVLLHGGAFPVRRGQRDRRAVATAVALARKGDVVVMFPEGTRRSKGLRKKHLARAHTGAARIALTAEVPLVPAAIVGTDSLRRLGPLRVAYGPPVDVADLHAETPSNAARIATERLMERIGELEAGLRAR